MTCSICYYSFSETSLWILYTTWMLIFLLFKPLIHLLLFKDIASINNLLSLSETCVFSSLLTCNHPGDGYTAGDVWGTKALISHALTQSNHIIHLFCYGLNKSGTHLIICAYILQVRRHSSYLVLFREMVSKLNIKRTAFQWFYDLFQVS